MKAAASAHIRHVECLLCEPHVLPRHFWSLLPCNLPLAPPFPAAVFWLLPPPRHFSASAFFGLNGLSAAAVADPKIDAMVSKAVEYLGQHQSANGAFTPQAGVGITALVTTGLLRNGRSPDDPLVARSLKFLEGAVQKDGGIYAPKLGYNNYETCIALTCFVAANADHRYDKLIKNAEKYLKATQWTEEPNENDPTHKIDKSDPFYGGAGYGKNKRPDLSNTSFLVDALKEAGNGPDDEAMKKALVFVSRCQNLESEHNTTPAAAKNPDGGFYYTPADGGESDGGQDAQRRPAKLRLDDLFRPEEHDLLRREGRRPARQGGRQVDPGTTTT